VSEEFIHAPVMVREVVAALQVKSGGNYIDATFGRGGHSAALLAAMDTSARLLALDQDPQAIAFGRQQYANEPRISFMQKNFTAIDTCANEVFGSGPQVDGIVFDLGVSSPQLDDAQRGFAFLRDGPLDMRMDPAADMSAADWLQHVDEAELVQVLFRYGEERYARRIAAAIVRARGEQAITRTGQLAEIVSAAVPKREPGKHPATRTFQAIRIYINRELESISNALPKALSVLKPRGRLAVISFHSLEDRIVKRYFREQGRGDPYPVDLPVPADQLAPQLKLVGKAQRPTAAELAANPRARSAVLRVVEKMEAAHA
jgi:16S rRNA (cytosine1402-N4)-methyltransferase